MVKITHNKYLWNNFQTAANLATKFKVSKRRILQVIADLKKEKNILEAIIIFPQVKTEELISSKCYMRLDIITW